MEAFFQEIEGLGIVVSPSMKQQFLAYKNHLQKINEVLNLTAIDDDMGIFYKHFYDCLLIAKWIPQGSHIADIGSGAGFPGMVLAIARPDVQVTCIEPTQKRTNFLSEVVEICQLKNVIILNERAENVIVNQRESYDVVCARAVAYLDVLSELCLPFVRVGGRFIAMKGQRVQEELDVSAKAIKILGGDMPITHRDHHPYLGDRYNLEIMKMKPTPKKYPRSYAKIKKTPLSGRNHESTH